MTAEQGDGCSRSRRTTSLSSKRAGSCRSGARRGRGLRLLGDVYDCIFVPARSRRWLGPCPPSRSEGEDRLPQVIGPEVPSPLQGHAGPQERTKARGAADAARREPARGLRSAVAPRVSANRCHGIRQSVLDPSWSTPARMLDAAGRCDGAERRDRVHPARTREVRRHHHLNDDPTTPRSMWR